MKTGKRLFSLCAVVLLGIGLTLSPAVAASKPIPPELTAYLPPLIRAHNFRCDTLDQMTFRARSERGDVYQAVCNEDTAFYRYRITMTPDNKVYIKPWSE